MGSRRATRSKRQSTQPSVIRNWTRRFGRVPRMRDGRERGPDAGGPANAGLRPREETARNRCPRFLQRCWFACVTRRPCTRPESALRSPLHPTVSEMNHPSGFVEAGWTLKLSQDPTRIFWCYPHKPSVRCTHCLIPWHRDPARSPQRLASAFETAWVERSLVTTVSVSPMDFDPLTRFSSSISSWYASAVVSGA